MQGESREEEILIKLHIKEKQQIVSTCIAVTQYGQVNLNEICSILRDNIELPEHVLFLYYDLMQGIYVFFQHEDAPLVPISVLCAESLIEIRVEEKISDELMANPSIKPESVRTKRSPQRDISQAFELVESWRMFHRKGTFTANGEKQKINLDKSAAILGIPRKTLEDYFLLLRNGLALGFNFHENRRRKIGILRAFLRQAKKSELKTKPQKSEQKILSDIRVQLFLISCQEMEQENFKAKRYSSSDEDIFGQIISRFEN